MRLRQNRSFCAGNSLAVQRLGLLILIADGPSSNPGQGTKIPQAEQIKATMRYHQKPVRKSAIKETRNSDSLSVRIWRIGKPYVVLM